MAASEKVGWLPRLPVAGAYYCMSVSSHTVSEPLAHSFTDRQGHGREYVGVLLALMAMRLLLFLPSIMNK